jgi:S-DNA-T family DNA segregation ATPase FtsK/SpoIIIE
LSSPEVAHVLVAGTTGSGKTALLRCLAVSLVLFSRPHQVQLAVIDPKGRGWESLESSSYLGWPIAKEADEGAQLLARLVGEMERRDRADVVEPHLVVIVDEMADLVQSGGTHLASLLTRLVQRGRQAGMHVVAATQRPTSALLGGLMKANFPVRLVGRVMSAQDAVVAAGTGGTGAERLRGRGAFILVARGEVISIQSAFIPEEAMKHVAQCAQIMEGAQSDGWSVSRIKRQLKLTK